MVSGKGPRLIAPMFEELVGRGFKTDYAVNKRKSSRRLNDFIVHLSTSFTRMKAASITTKRDLKPTSRKRQTQRAANGTINREFGCLKRMFPLAYQETPPHVLLECRIFLCWRNTTSGQGSLSMRTSLLARDSP